MSLKEELKVIADTVELPVEDVEETYEGILEEVNGNEENALKKLRMSASRIRDIASSCEDFRGYFLASSSPVDTSKKENETQYVRNCLFVDESEELYGMTLWNEAATQISIPIRKEVKFKAQERDPKNIKTLGIPASVISSFEQIDDVERDLKDFEASLDSIRTDLKGVEDYYQSVENYRSPVVYTEGAVKSVFNNVDNRGRQVVIVIDPTLGFDEIEEVAVKIPERFMRPIEADKEVAILGGMWKPEQRFDPETREYLDEPGDVQLQAWEVVTYGFGELL